VWQSAFDEAMRWHGDQTFAADPAIFASHAAAAGLLDFEAAEAIARRGLQVNPGEPFLLNNLAYSLLETGHLESGAAVLAKTDVEKLTTFQLLHYWGNQGLLAFKVGDPKQGRELYRLVMARGNVKGCNRWLRWQR
jgi:hypothetical protein